MWNTIVLIIHSVLIIHCIFGACVLHTVHYLILRKKAFWPSALLCLNCWVGAAARDYCRRIDRNIHSGILFYVYE